VDDPVLVQVGQAVEQLVHDGADDVVGHQPMRVGPHIVTHVSVEPDHVIQVVLCIVKGQPQALWVPS